MILNPEQQRAVNSPGHCLISACPGSGKTRVLVERAKRLLAIPGNKVATITFTKDAANEMIERLEKAMDGIASDRLTTGTFHSLAMKQLNTSRKKRAEAGEIPPPQPVNLISESQSYILMRRAWQAEAREINQKQLMKDIEALKATRMPAANPNGPLARAFIHYQQLLREQDALDFADLVILAADGLKLGKIEPIDCTHLLVDEMQDVDQTQFAWLMAHKERGKILTCVGDDDQSIYGFRHALGFTALRAFADSTMAKEITLGMTYRCSANVLTYATRLISKNRERIRKSITTAQSDPGVVIRHDFPDEADEAEAAGLFLNARPTINGRGEQCTAAILARTNNVLRSAEAMLKKNNVPFYLKGRSSFWSGGIPAQIRDLLGAFAGRGSRGVVMHLHAQQANRDLIRAVTAATQGMVNPVPFLLTKDWQKKLDKQALHDWAPMAASLSAIRTQLEASDYEGAIKRIAGMAVTAARSQKAAKLATVACDILFSLAGGANEKIRAIESMERSTKEKERDPRAIALMTLHGSKGLEFDYVWIMGVEHGVLPHKDSPVEEERRLCYVGMTRAKTHLTLSTAVEEGAESQFLKEMVLMRSAVTTRAAS